MSKYQSVDNSLATINSEDPNSSCLPIISLSHLHHFVKNPPNWVSESYIEHKTKRKRGALVNNFPFQNCHVDELQWEENTFCSRRQQEMSTPELLICHDMKNNYLDDRFVKGSRNHDAYRFYRWSVIDTFVYFSHHFVTIPPLGWINTAHRNGVNIFGTVITEWTDGSRICEEILKSDDEMKKVVQSLVDLCKLLHLDGWLINVENRVADAAKLCKFVEMLTVKQHQDVEGSRVIWYDSVTKNGDLRWQNELNERNKLFYDACDGIFINYSWSKQHLERTLQVVGEEKAHTVFIGVDVFGRNQYGGGRFNTKVAVDAIYEHRFSTAIFAPAWTHETICRPVDMAKSEVVSCRSALPVPNTPGFLNDTIPTSSLANNISDTHNVQSSLDLLKIFFNREDFFWMSLIQYYPTKELIHLPFSTSFCQGSGLKKWLNGQVDFGSPWFNINKQEIQPNVPNCHLRYQHLEKQLPDNEVAQDGPKIDNCMESYFEDSFLGGSCLKFTKIDHPSTNYISRVFICNFNISGTTYARVVSKSEYLSVILLAQAPDKNMKIELIPYYLNTPNYENPALNNSEKMYKDYVDRIKQENENSEYIKLCQLSNEDLRNAEKNILKRHKRLYIHPGEKNHWSIRYFELPNEINIMEIGVKLNGPPGCSALLGEFAIIPVT